MQHPRVLRRSFVLVFLALGSFAPRAAAQFDYSLAFDVQQRTWQVEGSFANTAEAGADVDFWIARWTPGAYHVADYGRYIDTLAASDGSGRELDVTRVSDSHFRIAAGSAERITVRYEALAISTGLATAEGMILDVESNRITSDYAYVTPVSLFGFVPGRLDEEFSLSVETPRDWKTATVLKRNDAGAYRAESFYRFEDSPFFFSPTLTTVETTAGGKPLDVTVHGKNKEGMREVVERCASIADAACELMGGAPYDRFHFLIAFVPEGAGSGLEHSFSTLVLANPQSELPGVWSLIAHEYFHLWCAERIHVEGIRRPDFTQPFETKTAWLNESMTEYMTKHVLFHAGLCDEAELFRSVAPQAQFERMVGQMPSHTETSLAASSWASMDDLMAWSMKMYMQGPRTMFGLDLRMRNASNGERGVVDLLRYALNEYSNQGRGFPEDALPGMLEKVAGGDLGGFWESHIDGTEPLDISNDIGVLGLEWVDGEIRMLEAPTEAQQAALADFLSAEG